MADTKAGREFDIVVYGATGYTGRLVAEHFVREYASQERSGPDATKWAMAGRSLAKLEEVRGLIGAPADTPLVVADADDPASLDALCRRTRVILTTVGPYQLYGSELVAACARTGTDYADLCGDPDPALRVVEHVEGGERRRDKSCTFRQPARSEIDRRAIGLAWDPGLSRILVRANAEWQHDERRHHPKQEVDRQDRGDFHRLVSANSGMMTRTCGFLPDQRCAARRAASRAASVISARSLRAAPLSLANAAAMSALASAMKAS